MVRTRGVVAAGHKETAQAAADILAAGGNAYDAVIASFWSACVAEPVLTSVGGGGFLLAQPASGPPKLFDFFVQTPKQKAPLDQLDFYEISADFGRVTQDFHVGMGSVATPGVVRGIFDLHRDLATMPMSELVQPACSLARNGICINDFQAYLFKIIQPIYLATQRARDTYESKSNPGFVIQKGEILSNPRFADFLDVLAREGDRFFYEGEAAQIIVQMTQAHGGHLKAEDLKDYRSAIRTPLSVAMPNATLLTNPMPSSGGTLISFGLTCAQSLLVDTNADSASQLQTLVEIMDATEHARLAQTTTGLERLMDKDLLHAYRQRISQRTASFRGTTQVSVADAFGNLASMTTSNGEGCGHLVPQCGFMLNNMLGEEDLNPKGFHLWQNDQRMTSMMAPTIIRSQGTSFVLGSGGSNRIRTAILQVLIHLLINKQPLAESVAHPRLHFERGKLDIEPGFDAQVIETLTARYPKNHVWDTLNLFFGGVHTVSARGKRFEGCGDARRGGIAIEVN